MHHIEYVQLDVGAATDEFIRKPFVNMIKSSDWMEKNEKTMLSLTAGVIYEFEKWNFSDRYTLKIKQYHLLE